MNEAVKSGEDDATRALKGMSEGEGGRGGVKEEKCTYIDISTTCYEIGVYGV